MIELVACGTDPGTMERVPFMLGLRDAANQTGLSYNLLRHMCLENKVAYIRAGRNFKINMDALIATLNTTPDKAAEKAKG